MTGGVAFAAIRWIAAIRNADRRLPLRRDPPDRDDPLRA
jgi:hypothetical protein